MPCFAYTPKKSEVCIYKLKTYKLKNARCAYFLHFPNRSWLRSFRLVWGLGGKKERMN